MCRTQTSEFLQTHETKHQEYDGRERKSGLLCWCFFWQLVILSCTHRRGSWETDSASDSQTFLQQERRTKKKTGQICLDSISRHHLDELESSSTSFFCEYFSMIHEMSSHSHRVDRGFCSNVKILFHIFHSKSLLTIHGLSHRQGKWIEFANAFDSLSCHDC